MADYSLKNLRDVENSAPEGAGDGLEARFGRKHLDWTTSASATSATAPGSGRRTATAIASRRRPTSSSAGPAGSASTTR